MRLTRIAVLVSGGGTNLQALIDAQHRGELANGSIAIVVASRADAYALERAITHGIPAATVARKKYTTQETYEAALLAVLQAQEIDMIVLAGFMHILSAGFVAHYPGRIINVHPALIPSFCGKGYYGIKVHEAALAYGVKVSGATVHIVNEVPDGGQILLQKAVDVLPNDTPERLQRRIMEQAEWVLLPQAVSLICKMLCET